MASEDLITRASFYNFFLQLPKHLDLSCFHKFYFLAFFDFTCNFLLQLESIFAQKVKVRFEKYALKLQYFSFILVFSLNFITSSLTDWQRLHVFNDATISLHYTVDFFSYNYYSSATTLQ